MFNMLKNCADDGVWSVAYEATPEHDGLMTLRCTRDGALLEEKAYSLHTHTLGYKEIIIPAGCTTEGELGFFCATCGVAYNTEIIAPIGHNYSDWYMNTNGTHSCSCDRCHDLQTENCKYVATVTVPTCTLGGYTTYVCSVCGHTYIADETDPLGHNWSEWVDNKDDTTHTRTCRRCGVQETQIHEWGKWIFNNDNTLCKNGTKTRYCALCGASQTVTAEKSSKFDLFLAKIKSFFLNIFKITINVNGNVTDAPSVDVDSDIDSDSDSDSDSGFGFIS